MVRTGVSYQNIVKTDKDLILGDFFHVLQRERDDRLGDKMDSCGICFAINELEDRRMPNSFQFLAQQTPTVSIHEAYMKRVYIVGLNAVCIFFW